MAIPTSAAPDRPILSAKQFGWATLAFAVFVIYGSLVPLTYRAATFEGAWAKCVSKFSKPVVVAQRSDWLANVLLFIPLSFLAMGWLCVGRRARLLGSMLLILPLCALFSALMEFSQIWFPPRDTSINDVVAETLGGAIGIGIWIAAGEWMTAYLRQFWTRHAARNWSIRLIPGYLVLLVIIHGMPFDLTLSPSCFKTKYRGHMILLTPFSAAGGESLDLVKKGLINIAWFLPAGILCAGLPGWWQRLPGNSNRSIGRNRYGRREIGVLGAVLRVFGVGVALAGTIEAMQFFVLSRYFDTTDIITGSLAVVAGWGIMRTWQQRGTNAAGEPSRSPLGLQSGLLAIWTAALVFISWEPFDFQFDAIFLLERWRAVSLIPFANYYAGNYLYSFNEIIQKTLLFVPFGLFLASAMVARRDGVIVVGAALAFAMFLEVGQLFLRRHNPGVSDLIIEPFGAWLGYLAATKLRVLNMGSVQQAFPPGKPRGEDLRASGIDC